MDALIPPTPPAWLAAFRERLQQTAQEAAQALADLSKITPTTLNKP